MGHHQSEQTIELENIVLDYVDDSPMFRKQVETLEDPMADLYEYIKEIMDKTKQYLAQGKRFGQVGRELGKCLNDKSHSRALFTNTYEKLGDLCSTLEKFHLFVNDMQDLHDQLLMSLQSVWYVPMVNFSHEVKKSRTYRREMKQTTEEYETTLNKVLSEHKGHAMVEMLRRQYELQRFDLVQHFNHVEARKKLVLTECFDSTIQKYSTYFKKGLDMVQETFAEMQQRQKQCSEAQVVLQQQNEAWKAARDKIERGDKGVQVVAARVSSQHRKCYDMKGYLFVRNPTKFPTRTAPKRRWFQLHGGKLFELRGKEQDSALICDLMLSTVRLSNAMPHSFEVIDSSQAKYLFQAESAETMQQWIDEIRTSTENVLGGSREADTTIDPEAQSILEMNPNCADCSAEPAEWMSINLGVVLCIECSGIHRSLGVHVSKVRSLSLDTVESSILSLVRDHLGNDRVNQVYEAVLAPGWTKPDPETERTVKEKYIKAKYDYKGFTSPLEDKRRDEMLFEGAQDGSIHVLMSCIAHRVNLEQLDRNETVLHRCARFGHQKCCEYLIQNNCSVVALDGDGKLPFEVAKAAGFEHLKLFLMQKMSLEQYHR